MINETINWAEAEKRYYKERDWLLEVKKLSKFETLSLRRTTIPEGASKVEHYNNIVEEAYQRAQSLGATYLICASNWLPVFCLSVAFERSFTAGAVQGSYTVGTIKGLPVIISPTMDSFEMLCGADTPAPEYDIESIDASKFILLKLED
jgi:hypothetical protein